MLANDEAVLHQATKMNLEVPNADDLSSVSFDSQLTLEKSQGNNNVCY